MVALYVDVMKRQGKLSKWSKKRIEAFFTRPDREVTFVGTKQHGRIPKPKGVTYAKITSDLMIIDSNGDEAFVPIGDVTSIRIEGVA